MSATAAVLPTIKTNNPTMIEMALDAVSSSSDKGGISVAAMKSYILSKYPTVDPNTLKSRLKKALVRCLEENTIVRPKAKTDYMAGGVMVGRYKKSAEKPKGDSKVKQDEKKSVADAKPTAKKPDTKKDAAKTVLATKPGSTKVAQTKKAIIGTLSFDSDSEEENEDEEEEEEKEKEAQTGSKKTAAKKPAPSEKKTLTVAASSAKPPGTKTAAVKATKSASNQTADKLKATTAKPSRSATVKKSADAKINGKIANQTGKGATKMSAKAGDYESDGPDASNDDDDNDDDDDDDESSEKQKGKPSSKAKPKVLAYRRKSGTLGSNGKSSSSTPKLAVKKGRTALKPAAAPVSNTASVSDLRKAESESDEPRAKTSKNKIVAVKPDSKAADKSKDKPAPMAIAAKTAKKLDGKSSKISPKDNKVAAVGKKLAGKASSKSPKAAAKPVAKVAPKLAAKSEDSSAEDNDVDMSDEEENEEEEEEDADDED